MSVTHFEFRVTVSLQMPHIVFLRFSKISIVIFFILSAYMILTFILRKFYVVDVRVVINSLNCQVCRKRFYVQGSVCGSSSIIVCIELSIISTSKRTRGPRGGSSLCACGGSRQPRSGRKKAQRWRSGAKLPEVFLREQAEPAS